MVSTTTPTTPTTLLDAVNELLKAIRVATVNSLATSDLNEDAAGAKGAIDTAAIQFQTKGWQFNTESGKIIDPDIDGKIQLPSNTLEVRSARLRSSGQKLVPRLPYLYDARAGYNTYTISEAVEVDIVVALPFEAMTSSARFYVTGMAARQWCPPKLPVGATFNWTKEVVESALVAFEQWDSQIASEDSLKVTSPHFSNMGRR